MTAGDAADQGPDPAPAASAVLLPSGAEVAARPRPVEHPELSAARADEPAEWDVVVLSSFGGPEGQDDVIPFLRNVTRGRGIPDERLEQVAGHYRAHGGVSPINAQNRALRQALQAELETRGLDLPVELANRNWEPYVPDVLRAQHAQGRDRILVLATSAFSGYSSCRQYREDWGVAAQETGLAEQVTIGKIRQFYDLPGFLAPFAQGLEEALTEVEQELPPAAPVRVLFAAHSVPDADAVQAGPERMRESFTGGSAYADQLLAASRHVMDQVAQRRDLPQGLSWDLVFQSRSGSPRVPWLEPDVNDAIVAGAQDGARAVIVVPIGFVSDHMEVLWDLDEEAAQTAQEHGLVFRRTPTPGTHPVFVAGLADLIEQRVAGRSAAPRRSQCAQGTWFDRCAPDCCVKVLRGAAGPRPTVAQRPQDEPLPVAVDRAGQVVRA